MLVLVVVAVVWLAVRVVAMLRLLVADDEEPTGAAVAVQDRPTPQDTVVAPSPRQREATFRETVIDVLRRPDRGPACLGGRDDAAYLSGWQDAVDWIGRGQDAKAPTWGDLAYMTGWYDGVRDVAAQRAR
jgi:hypothetical protein